MPAERVGLTVSFTRGPAIGSTVAAMFYRLIKYLEYETVQNNDDEGGEAVAPKGNDPKTASGAEDVEPKDGVPVEVTGFGGGLLQSQDAQPAAMANSGPLADPRDLSDKMDRLEGMMMAMMSRMNDGAAPPRSPDRISGETLAAMPAEKESHIVRTDMNDSQSAHAIPPNTLADHPAWVRRAVSSRRSASIDAGRNV